MQCTAYTTVPSSPVRCTGEKGDGGSPGFGELGWGCDFLCWEEMGGGGGESGGGGAGGPVVPGASIRVVFTWIGQWRTRGAQ